VSRTPGLRDKKPAAILLPRATPIPPNRHEGPSILLVVAARRQRRRAPRPQLAAAALLLLWFPPRPWFEDEASQQKYVETIRTDCREKPI